MKVLGSEICSKNKIRAEMRKHDNYPSLLEMDVWSVTSSNSYAMAFLSEKMYSFFRQGRSKEILETRRLQKAENSVYKWVLGYPQQGELVHILTTDNEQDALEKRLMEILNKLSNDNELIQKFKNVEQTNLEKHLKLFTVHIRELSENIELGHRIKGKCSIGY